jgi:hypothetical protein
MPAPSLLQAAEHPLFFKAADLLAYQRRLQNNPHYDNTSYTDQRFVDRLQTGIFEKTAYWCKQVDRRLPLRRYEYVMHQTWVQGTHFRKYSWGRFFLRGELDKAFYFTLGVDSGQTKDSQDLVTAGLVPAGPALILKLDGHSASDSKLTKAQYVAGEVLRQKLPLTARWLRISPEQLEEYNWPRLFKETVAFIGQHEADLRRIMAVARR